MLREKLMKLVWDIVTFNWESSTKGKRKAMEVNKSSFYWRTYSLLAMYQLRVKEWEGNKYIATTPSFFFFFFQISKPQNKNKNKNFITKLMSTTSITLKSKKLDYILKYFEPKNVRKQKLN